MTNCVPIYLINEDWVEVVKCGDRYWITPAGLPGESFISPSRAVESYRHDSRVPRDFAVRLAARLFVW